jgi:hypothetical protein
MRVTVASVSLLGCFGPRLLGINPATPSVSKPVFHRHKVACPIPNPLATATSEAIFVLTSCTAASRRPTSSSAANAKLASPDTNTTPPSAFSTRPAIGPIGVASAGSSGNTCWLTRPTMPPPEPIEMTS